MAKALKKLTPKISNDLTPIFAIVVGIGAGLLLIDLSVTGGVVGMALGLAGTGLYENINMIGKITKPTS